MEPETDKTQGVSSSDIHGQDHHHPGGMPPPRRPSSRIDREHPIGGEMSDILRGLLRYIRLPWLTQRYAQTPVLALFSFINGCISIGLMSVLALITKSPFVFPSLGPTAFLFFYTPRAPSASPRNTIVGHTIGALAGYFSLVVTGLTAGGSCADRRGDVGPRDCCCSLARPDSGFDGALQVASSASWGNDADRFARYPDQTLATALATRRRCAAHPASLRH